MAWIRYISYVLGVALLTGMLTQLEIAFPGSLKLQVFVSESDKLGTSEFSPVEIIQPLILGICGLLMAWVGAMPSRNYSNCSMPICKRRVPSTKS